MSLRNVGLKLTDAPGRNCQVPLLEIEAMMKAVNEHDGENSILKAKESIIHISQYK
jgi:hypothetical protein